MTSETDTKRPLWVDVTLLVLAGVLFICMILLGNWQLDRLSWKLDLIERVESRAFGEPVAAPMDQVPPEYLRVTVTGVYRFEDTLSVKAVTELGAGHWILTPIDTNGATVWINRGFVPTGLPLEQIAEPLGEQTVVGLVRLNQSDGTLLEVNDPAAGRWVSVDVHAMSAAVDLLDVAPYYISADHGTDPTTWPRGGLTKVEFRNTHLSYALTWYAMAILFAAAMAFVIWDRKRGS